MSGTQIHIVPRCGKCGMNIYGLCIENSNFDMFPSTVKIIKRLEPSECPNCHMIIGKVEVDIYKRTVIIKER